VAVRNTEALAVALFQDDASAEFGVDPLKMQGMDGNPALVRFPRSGQDAQAQLGLLACHFFLAALLDVMSRELAGAAAAFLSARFSLRDLPDFFDAV
jgi:hypothetical protein